MRSRDILNLAIGEWGPGFSTFVKSNNFYSYEDYRDSNVRPDAPAIRNVWLQLSHLHTSEFIDLLYNAKRVVLCNPVKWNNLDIKEVTLGWMNYISNSRQVYNYNLLTKEETYYSPPENLIWNDIYHKENVRQVKPDQGQIWIAGCSYAHGWFLENQKDRYGQLFADHMNMPVSFITEPGASNSWIVEQIIKADVGQNDVVVIGLTGSSRQTIYLDDRLHYINIHNFSKELALRSFGHLFKKNLKDDLTASQIMNQSPKLRRYLKEELLISEHTTYETISHYEQIVNYLEKLKVKYLIGWNVAIEEAFKFKQGQLLSYLALKKNTKTFLFDPGHVDKTKDAIHPGPRQHKIYADQLIDLYNKLYGSESKS